MRTRSPKYHTFPTVPFCVYRKKYTDIEIVNLPWNDRCSVNKIEGLGFMPIWFDDRNRIVRTFQDLVFLDESDARTAAEYMGRITLRDFKKQKRMSFLAPLFLGVSAALLFLKICGAI